jgi:hypothetical protein
MSLTVEDGSVVAGANSYVSVSDAQAYATARGIVVTVTEALLLKAIDYLESLRAEYQGIKTDGSQSLQWPRSGVYLDGYEVGEDEIPDVLINAQIRLACEAYTYDLMPTTEGREVIMERVEGAVTVQYAPSGDVAPQPTFTAASAMLAPLLKSALFGGSLRSVRV